MVAKVTPKSARMADEPRDLFHEKLTESELKVGKEKATKKDTRMALDSATYQTMLKNSTDVELFESMFRVKGVRNVQHMNEKQTKAYNQCREICSSIGDIVAEDGTIYELGVYCRKT